MYVIIVLTLIVIPVIVWGTLTLKRKRNNRQMMKFVMTTAAFPIEKIPETASGFSAFLKNVHAADISMMTYMEQVRYILKNRKDLQCGEMEAFIQLPGEYTTEKEKCYMVAAGAYLGELIRVCQPHAEWKSDPENPVKTPYLEVECLKDSLISSHPFDLMLDVLISGDIEKALTDLEPFESREKLDESLKNHRSPNVYNAAEKTAYRDFLTQNLGMIEKKFNLINSPEMLVDLYVIRAAGEYKARRLVTSGIGGRTMRLPEDAQKKHSDRIELLLDLPDDWPPDGQFDPEQISRSWPFRLLKVLAGYPWNQEIRFRLGYAVSWPETLVEDIGFKGLLLAAPAIDYYGKCEVMVSPGKNVEICQLVPLYQEELDYRIEHGTRKLHELLGEKFSYIADPTRENAVTAE